MKIALYVGDWEPEAWVERVLHEFPQAEVVTPENLGDPSEVEYAVVWKPPQGFLQSLPNLKLICNLGAGVDALLNDSTLPDVPIVRVIDPDLTTRMSEWIALQCLLHHRKTLDYLAFQSKNEWVPRTDPVASEVSVGFLGMGVLGQDASAKLKMLGYNVMGWSRSPKQIDGVEMHHGAAGLDDLLACSDILVCLLPHTPQTEAILNLELFGKLKQGGPLGGPVVINAGRGKLQVEDDIVTAIETGILKGASLDVFETEPLPAESPLWALPNVIITPHNSANSTPNATTAYLARQIRLFEAGQPVESLVEKSRGY